MAKGLYFGVGGGARKVKKLYFGVGNVARKIKKIYIGVNNVARLCYTSVQPGQVIFTSSQNWTVPDGVYTVQVFLVGGGGSAGANQRGGCGGYTKTQTVSVTPGQVIPVAIGAGATEYDTPGGSSSFGSVFIAGGDYYNGGSGGGAPYIGTAYPIGGTGGSNGSNGGGPISANGEEYPGAINIGLGQGTTTKTFGESTGTLYAGGGGGLGSSYDGDSSSYTNGYGRGGAGGGGQGAMRNTYSSNYHDFGTNGTPNTGGGGGSGLGSAASKMKGGSGIVIVRWAEQ